MTSRNERRRQRYAEDPEYRERVRAVNRRSAEKGREETNARRRQKRAEDPEYREKQRIHNDNHRLVAYGLTREGYDRMLAQQHGACAICKQKSQATLCIDHDHSTGQVRGLLCRKCNAGLGLFDDSPCRLRAAAAYLEAWRKRAGMKSAEAEPPQDHASCRHDENRCRESDKATAGLRRRPCVPCPGTRDKGRPGDIAAPARPAGAITRIVFTNAEMAPQKSSPTCGAAAGNLSGSCENDSAATGLFDHARVANETSRPGSPAAHIRLQLPADLSGATLDPVRSRRPGVAPIAGPIARPDGPPAAGARSPPRAV
jgi:Recombination endonuclease VII